MSVVPKVSVCIITYNHEGYIGACLSSILAQVVDFQFEIIIADDCSSDKTREVICDFVERYPGRIKTIFHERNVGVCANYKSAHDAALGEYVAHCDGDDFWYSGKLAKQVETLDVNPGAVQCWTCANVVDDGGKVIRLFPSKLGRIFYPKIISSKNIALSYALVGQHSTQLYRRNVRPVVDLDEYLDYWVAFNLSRHGESIYLKEVLGAYRFTTTPSITRNTNAKKKAVDYLARHLLDVYRIDPSYGIYVKSNLMCRLLFSKLKGHDVSEVKFSLDNLSHVKFSFFLFLKSFFYFLVQKI